MIRRLGPGLVLVLCDAVLGWLNYHAGDDVQLVALTLVALILGALAGLAARWAGARA